MIFIDTGAFLARYLTQDQYHSRAIAAWERIRRRQEPCFTSNFVLDEFFTLLARRAGYGYAAERARHILASSAFTVLRPALEDELEAVNLFSKYADQEVSFTDCVSFVLIRSNRIRKVFSFNRHFRHSGAEILS